MKSTHALFLIIFSLTIKIHLAGPILGAACSAGCAGLVCACYSAAGFTFGTVVASAAAPAAILACNAAFGTCMSKCAAAFALPTP